MPLRARRGALVGCWPVRRAAVVIRNPFPHVAIHSSHVRLKAQSDQMLRERQHFCLIPGAVLLSRSSDWCRTVRYERYSAGDRQRHVEARTFQRMPSFSPPFSPLHLLSTTDTFMCTCPASTPSWCSTPFASFSGCLCHSACIFAVAVALTVAVWQRQAAAWQLEQRQLRQQNSSSSRTRRCIEEAPLYCGWTGGVSAGGARR